MKQTKRRPNKYWMRGMLGLAVFAALPFSNGHGQQFPLRDTSQVSPLSRQSNDPSGRIDNPMRPGEEEKRLEALNALRQKEMTADTAKLLALATELKAQMDKTDKDTLSIGVIRKAEQIEKLAHSVREKMKESISK